MPSRLTLEFRVVIERDLPPPESRVMREEISIRSEEAARELDRYWRKHGHNHGAKGWVESRTVTDWQELSVADRERRDGLRG